MTRDEVLATLRAHERQLKAAGVVGLSLFGSTVRGDHRPDSDIDLLATFDSAQRLSLLDVAGIQVQLSEMLRKPVDLVEECALKPGIKKSVKAVRAF